MWCVCGGVNEVGVQRGQGKLHREGGTWPHYAYMTVRFSFLLSCPRHMRTKPEAWKQQHIFWKLKGEALSENFFLSYPFSVLFV
jgi:hypothetical protein